MALSAFNDTPGAEFTDLPYLQKGSTTCYGGGLVVAAADGYAKPGVKATGLVILGVAVETSINAGADGAASVACASKVARNGKRQMFKFKNDATDPLTIAHIGRAAYVFDDITFTSLSTGATQGGVLRRLDSDGVWIELL